MSHKKEIYYTIFKKELLRWNRFKNKREMPWKFEKNPYRIWLSEIILQQTRVEQGKSYYLNFIKKYPTIFDLAKAEDQSVMKLWEGLGYYSRCRNLLATARAIVKEKDGIFPNTYEELVKLKGIGPYTAAAIASFAYQLPYAVVDGNVIRVLSRFFGINKPSNTNEGKKLFEQLAQNILSKNQPDKFNQAIMDFGATICKPALPLCVECVMKDHCYAFQKNLVDTLPVKTPKLKKKKRQFIFLIYRHKKNIYIHKRTEKDIWKDLYQFHLLETTTDLFNQKQNLTGFIKKQAILKPVKISHSKTYRQQLTHQSIEAIFSFIEIQKPIKIDGFLKISSSTINEYGFPKIIREFIADYSGEFC